MMFFRTLAQRRILRYYWATNKPFTVDELIDKKVLHSRLYGKILLSFMKLLGQVLPREVTDGQKQYIGTTDSQLEWRSIQWDKSILSSPLCLKSVYTGMNRYEIKKFTRQRLELLLTGEDKEQIINELMKELDE